jgi:predicted DCC family thiol-disulfide oxidoreductase YuxK
MKWIIFFDGECGLCSRTVRRLAHLDRENHLLFSPLQGEIASSLNLNQYADKKGGSLVILRKSDNTIFIESDGVCEIFSALGGYWKLLRFIKIIPHPIRDRAYQFIAKNRYSWFGDADSCTFDDEITQSKLISQSKIMVDSAIHFSC